MVNINWHQIKTFHGSQNNAFEELVCQLARAELMEGRKSFTRVAAPDGGVEAYCTLENGDEIGWQAKYFHSMADSQWRQIEKSFLTALSTHPKLTRYHICIPLDRQDPRLTDQKWFMDKWNESVVKWKTIAEDKGIHELDIDFWGSSELIDRLCQEQHVGRRYYWFSQEEFSDVWMKKRVEDSIGDLGNRYLPKQNIDLKISDNFEALKKSDAYRDKVKSIFHDYLLGINLISKVLDTDHLNLNAVEDRVREIKFSLNHVIESLLGKEVVALDMTELDRIVKAIHECVDLVMDHINAIGSEVDDKEKKELIYKLNQSSSANGDFEDFLESGYLNLAVNPQLIIYGDAGIGKSHMLADFIDKELKNGKPNIFVLGTHLNSDEPPWYQIINHIFRLKCNEDEVLGALNAKAEARRERILFVIDAINEGKGKIFWPNHIRSFLRRFQDYPWVAVVLSVRTTYKNLLIDEPLENHAITKIQHRGFEGVEYEAALAFFSEYGLDLPSTPLLNPEFSNPLFLYMFCRGLASRSLKKFEKGSNGIVAIYENFIAGIEDSLCKPEKFDYPKGSKLLTQILSELAEYQVTNNTSYTPYGIALRIINDKLSPYTHKKGFLEAMISEGVVSKNLMRVERNKYEDGVYFTYERFSDFHVAMLLLEDIDHSSAKKAFKKNGALRPYLDKSSANGVLEAFAILIPEKMGIELFELISIQDQKQHEPLCFATLESLLWRGDSNINLEKLPKYFMGVRFSNLYSRGRFKQRYFEIIYALAGDVYHPFNAKRLHSKLSSLTLPDRDVWWTMFLNEFDYEDHAFHRFIAWTKRYGCSAPLSREARVLLCIAVSWLFTSTNNSLRDSATRSLVELLNNKLQIAKELLDEFQHVDDPYVHERIFLAIYGAVLCSSDKSGLGDLCNYLVEGLFSEEEVYPNVLVRDSARNICEYAVHLGLASEISGARFRPPYRSKFPKKLPSLKSIDKYDYDYKSPDFKDYQWSQNAILDSMTTEYGRGTGGYGDFGRYVFQSNVSNWRYKFDPQNLSNYACEIIFKKFGYDVKKHGEFDRNLRSSSRSQSATERIGKKYQWMAMYEVISRLADNFPMKDRYASGPLAEETWFDGPWEPFLRAIDPSNSKLSLDQLNELPKIAVFDIKPLMLGDHVSWSASTDNLIDPKGLILVQDERGVDWVVLDTVISWDEEKPLGEERWGAEYKSYWHHIRGYFVDSQHRKIVMDYLNGKQSLGGMGGWMPQAPSFYQIYSREYPWAPSYNFFKDPYYNGEDWSEINEYIGGEFESFGKVMPAVEEYRWERGSDSKDTVQYSMPKSPLLKALGFHQSAATGVWLDRENKVACYDEGIKGDSNSRVCIRKDLLDEYLAKTGLELFWTCLGEKQLLGKFGGGRDYETVEISAIYTYQDGSIAGNYTVQII